MVIHLPVTPFVGVWIETCINLFKDHSFWSHPSWVCGLKLSIEHYRLDGIHVTPFVGVWIETSTTSAMFASIRSHTLRGCVD